MLIVTAADNRYAPGALATLYSVWLHNPEASLFVLGNGLSDDTLARFASLSQRIGKDIGVIDVSQSAIQAALLPDERLTVSAYARLLIPDYFPDEERALYLDCDMIVTGDLSPIYHGDFGDAYLKAVPDYGPGQKELDDLEMPLSEYFNSGLMVLNIAAMRADNISQRCLDLAAKRVFMYHDQSVMNVVCRGRVQFLPLAYNIFVDVPMEIRREFDLPFIGVIHFVGPYKPWLYSDKYEYGICLTYSNIWKSYVSNISDLLEVDKYRPIVPNEKIGFSAKLSRWNRKRKEWMGLVMGKEKYVKRARFKKVEHDLNLKLDRILAHSTSFDLQRQAK